VENSAFAAQLLSRLDIFFLWTLVLLVIALTQTDSLPRTKAIANVALVSLLLLLVQSGIGSLLASAGGLAVQRPFF